MAPEESGSKQCPTCGSWDVRWAMIEDGGLGNWCDNCKKSLKAMAVQENEGSLGSSEPAQLKYKPSIIGKTLFTIVVICVSVLVFWCLFVGFSFWVDYYSSGGYERSNNTIAQMHGRHLLTCFESHYADYQRYPLSIDHLQRECYDYLDKNGVINDLLKKKVILNVTLLNEEDYEFVILHKKGNREYKMNSFSSYIRFREKGEKEWRKL